MCVWHAASSAVSANLHMISIKLKRDVDANAPLHNVLRAEFQSGDSRARRALVFLHFQELFSLPTAFLIIYIKSVSHQSFSRQSRSFLWRAV